MFHRRHTDLPRPDISRALAIDGWMEAPELEWLASHAVIYGGVIIEVGCYIGRSTRVLAEQAYGTVYAVDIWPPHYQVSDPATVPIVARHPYPIVDFVENMRGLTNIFMFPCGLKELVIPYKADMIFIDGDHTFASVQSDICEAQKRLRPKGLLCGHDYDSRVWPDVTRAVRWAFGEDVHHVTGTGIWWVNV